MANIDMAESHDRNDFWKSAASAAENDPSILHQSSTIVRYPQIFNHWLTINSPLEPTLNHYESLLINY